MNILCSAVPGSLRQSEWDRWLARDPRGHLLQTWAWGALKETFGWRAVRLAVAGQREGEVLGGAQVLYRRVGPLSMGYLPKGPWFAQDSPCGAIVEAEERLWQAVHQWSRRMRAIALKVEPDWEEPSSADAGPGRAAVSNAKPDPHAWLVARGFVPSPPVQPRRTIVVDLSASEDETLSRMKSKWRYNVRLSQRRGVEVREGSLADIDTFYRLMTVTGERDAFAVHSEAYYRQAWELFAPQGRAQLLMAYHDGVPLSGLMAFAFGRRAYYLYGASSNEGRELMPNHGLQWRAMQWAKNVGCTSYDLWGITDADGANAELSGVERFKEGFGGQVVRSVGAYDRVYLRPLYWAYTQLRQADLV